MEGTFVQPTALGIDNSDPSSGGRRVRIVVSEGRKHEVQKHPPCIEINQILFLLPERVSLL